MDSCVVLVCLMVGLTQESSPSSVRPVLCYHQFIFCLLLASSRGFWVDHNNNGEPHSLTYCSAPVTRCAGLRRETQVTLSFFILLFTTIARAHRVDRRRRRRWDWSWSSNKLPCHASQHNNQSKLLCLQVAPSIASSFTIRFSWGSLLGEIQHWSIRLVHNKLFHTVEDLRNIQQ